MGLSENFCQAPADTLLLLAVYLLYFLTVRITSNDRMTGEPSIIRDLEEIRGDLIAVLRHCYLNTLRTGLLNCLNARSRGLTFRHRASCI